MVTSCICRTRLPLQSAHAAASDLPNAAKFHSLPAGPPHNRGTPTISNLSHFPTAAVLRKFSSPCQSSRPSRDLSSSAKSARRGALLCAVVSFANVNGSSAIKAAGQFPKDFSWHDDELLDGKKSDPIQYDNRDPPTNVYAPGRRIVAIGDVHGDLARTEMALQLAGVLSSDGHWRWIGGNSVFVQVGDILDRGEDEIAILSLLHNLGQQALLRGGAVFQINGNHETMNVGGDYRFVEHGGFEEAENFKNYCEEEHKGDYEAAFSGWYLASKIRKASKTRPVFVSWILNPLKMQTGAVARAFLFNPGGPIARKLSQHGVVLKVNDWLFAHGGVLPHHAEYGLEKLNKEVALWMRGELFQEGNQLPFIAIRGFDSIVWSRLYSRDEYNTPNDKIKACELLEETLEAVGAKALVVGHTPQPFGANCECKGQVWRIDVGMSSGVLNAEPEVLEINGNEARVLSRQSYEQENSISFKFTDVQL